MGVSGSGKTTVGEALAARLAMPFVEADALHPKANRDKMTAGIPLTDDDRWPWLDIVGARIEEVRREGHGVIMTSPVDTGRRSRRRARVRLTSLKNFPRRRLVEIRATARGGARPLRGPETTA